MIKSINILSIIASILIPLLLAFVVYDGIRHILDAIAVVIVAIIVFIAIQVFFLPVRIADSQDHPNLLPITVLTIAGGWTGILWIGALIWSLYTPQVEIKVNTTIIESKEKGE